MSEQIKSAIIEAIQTFERLYAAGEIEKSVESSFMADAVCFPHGTGPVSGEKLLEAYLAMRDNAGVTRYENQSINVIVFSETAAVHYSSFTGYDKDGHVLQTGHLMCVWMKQGETWKIKLEMFNLKDREAAAK